MEFTIKAGKETTKVASPDHESALVKYLMARRRVVLGVKGGARADELFSELPRKATVSGGGASKSYRVKWEKVGRTRFSGSRFVFTFEESRLGRFFSFR